MVRKFVGRILPNIMELTKGDMDKKQDKMDALTAEDMKDIWPPFSVKEELSKSAPVQITLLDAEDQPLVGQSFTIKKSNSLLTSGKTNNSGLCVYNEPEVMTCDATPFTLEYNENNVELAMEYSNGTYASFTVKQSVDSDPIVEITDTDAGPCKIAIRVNTRFQGSNTIQLELYKTEEDRTSRQNVIKTLDLNIYGIGEYYVVISSDDISNVDFDSRDTIQVKDPNSSCQMLNIDIVKDLYGYIVYPSNQYTQNENTYIYPWPYSDTTKYYFDEFGLSSNDKLFMNYSMQR